MNWVLDFGFGAVVSVVGLWGFGKIVRWGLQNHGGRCDLVKCLNLLFLGIG